MKPTLQLKLSQHLTLTPQLQQSIRLLQLSTLELNAEVERLLQENPLLEKADDEESVGARRRSSPPRWSLRLLWQTSRATSADDSRAGQLVRHPRQRGATATGARAPATAATTTTRHFSRSRWRRTRCAITSSPSSRCSICPLRDRQIVAALIDALDEDGYLTTSLEELLELFPEELEIDADELSIALKHLQNMEPAGVGARDAAECLCAAVEGAARVDAVSRPKR